MYDIPMDTMSAEFLACWQSAGHHLNQQVDGGIQFWLRAHPYPPFLEHLSFRLGNQLFFIRVEDVEGRVDGPGALHGLKLIAGETGGHACILPMKRQLSSGWVAAAGPGWGLVDAITRQPINPVSLVTGEKIPMTLWEIQDMAVQVVRGQLEASDYELMSWQSNPGVDPSLWFIGDSGGPEWVVVRPAVFPKEQAERPSNWGDIAAQSQHLSSIGHFASVAIASLDQLTGEEDGRVMPLLRGHALDVEFAGFE